MLLIKCVMNAMAGVDDRKLVNDQEILSTRTNSSILVRYSGVDGNLNK